MATVDRKLLTREILLGFWKVHILHHAAEEPLVGQWVLNELRRHGYDISPGTLYPLLKRMERNGWLTCKVEEGGPRARRFYHLTEHGRAVLGEVRDALKELQHEVTDEASHGRSSQPKADATAAGASRSKRASKKPARRAVTKRATPASPSEPHKPRTQRRR